MPPGRELSAIWLCRERVSHVAHGKRQSLVSTWIALMIRREQVLCGLSVPHKSPPAGDKYGSIFKAKTVTSTSTSNKSVLVF